MAHKAKVSVTLRDSRGRTTTRVYGLKEATTIGTAETDAAALVALLLAVTKLGLCHANLIWDMDVTATSPVDPSNVDGGGTMSGWISLYQKKASLKFPDPEDDVVNADGTLIFGAGDLAAFLAAFEAAATATVSDGEQVAVGGWIGGVLDKK